jgi:hypothetical protein
MDTDEMQFNSSVFILFIGGNICLGSFSVSSVFSAAEQCFFAIFASWRHGSVRATGGAAIPSYLCSSACICG